MRSPGRVLSKREDELGWCGHTGNCCGVNGRKGQVQQVFAVTGRPFYYYTYTGAEGPPQ